MANLPTVSFLALELPFQKEGNTKLQIEVRKSGFVESHCSVNVLLGGSSLYYPIAGQYSGRKLIFNWLVDSPDIQVVEIPILPSSNKVEYLDIFLTDFLRCEPGDITKATLGLHDVAQNPTFAPSDGTYSQVISTTESGEKVIEFQPIYKVVVAPDSFIEVGEESGSGGIQNQVITPQLDDQYFVINNEKQLSFKDSFVDQLARPPSIVQEIEAINQRLSQFSTGGKVAPELLVIEDEVEEVDELRIEHGWQINPFSIITMTVENEQGNRESLGIAYEIEDNVAITFYPYAPTTFYYKITALK